MKHVNVADDLFNKIVQIDKFKDMVLSEYDKFIRALLPLAPKDL